MPAISTPSLAQVIGVSAQGIGFGDQIVDAGVFGATTGPGLPFSSPMTVGAVTVGADGTPLGGGSPASERE